jgi:hypothetical protein
LAPFYSGSSCLNQNKRLPRLHGAGPSAALDKSVSRYSIAIPEIIPFP